MKDRVGLDELKAYMRYKDVSQYELADAIGVSITSLNQKINGKHGKEFTSSEIVAIGEYLDLSAKQILCYFFPSFVNDTVA